ncbi:MAG: hypothetical protein VB050_01040 [Geobacteraceae bacterium]|nr:hypothetical protein [Geobacteraceae bacterium]
MNGADSEPPLSDHETVKADDVLENKRGPIFFAPDHALTIDKSGSGTGVVTGPDLECGTVCYGLFLDGTVIELIAAPDKGSSFVGWSGGGCSGIVPCLITMNASTELTAIFKKVFSITFIADNCGKIEPVDPLALGLAYGEKSNVRIVAVDSGSDLTVKISPDPGCRARSVKVDGVTVAVADTYTFHDIAADHKISAVFVSGTEFDRWRR